VIGRRRNAQNMAAAT